MFTAIISVLGINLLTQYYKDAVAKYGNSAIHVMVFIFSLLATVVWAYAQTNPTFMGYIEHAGILFASAIAAYQVVIKQINSVVTPFG